MTSPPAYLRTAPWYDVTRQGIDVMVRRYIEMCRLFAKLPDNATIPSHPG